MERPYRDFADQDVAERQTLRLREVREKQLDRIARAYFKATGVFTKIKEAKKVLRKTGKTPVIVRVNSSSYEEPTGDLVLLQLQWDHVKNQHYSSLDPGISDWCFNTVNFGVQRSGWEIKGLLINGISVTPDDFEEKLGTELQNPNSSRTKYNPIPFRKRLRVKVKMNYIPIRFDVC